MSQSDQNAIKPMDLIAFQDTADLVVLPDGSKPIRLGSGTIAKILGEGGVSVVYEIYNKQLEVKRAVKLLKPNYTSENRNRFDNEIKITAQLSHPNIIDIHAVGLWNGLPYIEMEIVDGISLETLIDKSGALPLEFCTAVSLIIAKALKYTHGHKYQINGKTYKGILHRDLKPANILCAHSGKVKLSDFGIATPTRVSMHTVEGNIVGSMQYVSPEQLEGKELDVRADIFSFGCVVYEMLSGFKAFPDVNVAKLIPARMSNSFEPLGRLDLKIPARLKKLVHKCMSIGASRRPDDMQDIIQELEYIHRRITPLTPDEVVSFYIQNQTDEKKIISLRHKKWPAPLLAALVLGIAGFAVIATSLTSSLEERPPKPGQGISRESGPLTPPPEKVFKEQAVAKRPSPPVAGKNRSTVPRKKVMSQKQPPEPQRKATVPARKSAEPEREVAFQAASDLSLPSKKAAETQDESPLEAMWQRYDETNLLAIMEKAVARRKYDDALLAFSEMGPNQASSNAALVYHLRASRGVGKLDDVYFRQFSFNDAEYHLAYAQLLYTRKRITEALKQLDLAAAAPAHLLDGADARMQIRLWRGRCLSSRFFAQPTEQHKKDALDAWFDIKYALRNAQSHAAFKEANLAIRNINQNSRSD
ncbi:MAG: protein kinase [Chitinivibrionales bacterium]|nr:protein kinase [Chitinivibrionales bacterium]